MRCFSKLSLTAGVLGSIACSAALAADAPGWEDQARAQWRETMLRMETPHAGCFHASYPSMQWEPVTCRTAIPGKTHPLPRNASGGTSQTTGNGNDYALGATGLISQTVGAFPSVSNVTSESSVGVPQFGGGGILGPNEYSLQINTNANSATSACSGGASGCTVWQQFIYATDYPNSGTAGVFMQYWLLNYGAHCPSGYFSASPHCYKNSPIAGAPDVPITGLPNLKLTGAVVPGGNDTVTFANGTQATSVSASDSVLGVATVWTQSEFNVIGDAGGSEAEFNVGASITVNVAVQDGSTSAPTCLANAGTTGETNNLNLGPCSAAGGTTASIQFAEENKGYFQWVSGQHSGPIGSPGDIATAFIKNTGTETITGISYSCSCGSWIDYGGPSSLAPGVTAGFSCQSQSYNYCVVFNLSGTSATNSPFSTPAF